MSDQDHKEETKWRFRRLHPTDRQDYLSCLTDERLLINPLISEDEFFTTEEIAKKLKLTEEVVRELIRRGELHGVKIGKAYRIPAADLETFLQVRYTRRKKGDNPHVPDPENR